MFLVLIWHYDQGYDDPATLAMYQQTHDHLRKELVQNLDRLIRVLDRVADGALARVDLVIVAALKMPDKVSCGSFYKAINHKSIMLALLVLSPKK